MSTESNGVGIQGHGTNGSPKKHTEYEGAWTLHEVESHEGI